jgi:hypothetical protein
MITESNESVLSSVETNGVWFVYDQSCDHVHEGRETRFLESLGERGCVHGWRAEG